MTKAKRIGKYTGIIVGLTVGVPVAALMVASRPHFNIQHPAAIAVWLVFSLILVTILPYTTALFFSEVFEAISNSRKSSKRQNNPEGSR